MRAPTLSEPKSTFPTYQVPQVSAMRGSAPRVQQQQQHQQQQHNDKIDEHQFHINGDDDYDDRREYNHQSCIKIDQKELNEQQPPQHHNHNDHMKMLISNNNDDMSMNVVRVSLEKRAVLPSKPTIVIDDINTNDNKIVIDSIIDAPISVINGSSCRRTTSSSSYGNNSNIRMQSVTENCLLNYVTVPKIQRNDQRTMVAHNNNYNNNDNIIINYNNNNNSSDKLVYKFGALPFGRDIPNQKSDDLEVLDLNNALMMNLNDDDDDNDGDNINDVDDDDDNDAIDDVDKNATIPNVDNDQSNNYNDNNDANVNVDIVDRCNDVYMKRTGNIYSIPLRLRGGGESSLSTGTSGWGTPPSQQASNNNVLNTSGWGVANSINSTNTGTQQWNNNANRPPTTNQGSTPQDANKVNSNLNTNGQQSQQQQQQTTTSQSNNSGWGQPGNKPTTTNNGAPPNVATPSAAKSATNNNNITPNTTNSTKQQLEQLNNMREAIFSQDGWGGQHVNQDTLWDIPNSPEPPMKMDGSGPPPWKPAVNNGTELWEANLRNGGQPPPQPQQKTPWGHTPSTNIGGTWGEDDDADSSNVWTGVPSAQQQWGNAANTGAMWGGKTGPKKDNDWGTNTSNSGWGDPRSNDPRAAAVAAAAAAAAMDPRSIGPDLRDMRAASADPMRILDPRDQMRIAAGGGDMRGDPRGITGRLNGAGTEAFWGQSAAGGGGPHGGTGGAGQHLHHQGKMATGGPGGNAGTGGWEEPSPPTQRRNMPNYDDGTSLWGNPQQGSHWKDLPTGAGMGRGGNSNNGPPGMAPTRLKADGSVWCHGGGGAGGGGGGVGRNGAAWDEPGPGAVWEESVSWYKMKGNETLWEDHVDWSHKQLPNAATKQLTKEMVWNSKQFRMLVDMGYKKEDVENALRMREMNMEDALDMLSPLRNQDAGGGGWRSRHDDHYEHQQFPTQRFPGGGPATAHMSFPPKFDSFLQAGGGGGGNTPNLLNNMNTATGPSNSLINNISPAVVQKMLTQGSGGGTQGFGGGGGASGRNLQPQSQPSTQQLRMLVQQIQMAVQAGYLNHQILNQPLAPQTLVLLNQLLQQIKTLQQFMSQHTIAQSQCINGKPNNALLQCSVLITKTKQQITNLQNQIAAQQAIYVKQQHQGGLSGAPTDLFKTNPMHDSINALQNNFSDLGIKDTQNQQQSRLNQWINKDKEEGGEFSRAPGSSSKPLTTSPNMNPLGLTQPDGPWSSGRTGDTGWPETGGGDTNSDGKDGQWPTPAQPSLTDLVPEFEPGKPWKGSQMTSIEDDPSITPGSVVRPSLSIATIKDNELFNMNPNKSPPAGEPIQPLSLSSSTWSFNPPSSTSSAFTSPPQSKLPSTKGLSDLNPTTAVTSELWGAPKSRGPPPGLSAKSGGAGASLANGWTSQLGASSWGGGGGGQRGSGSWATTSPWLLLRNLTAQIDGSTLRTLCMQHGPLQSFHLSLHQGFALAKYSTAGEATKAQTALNNCVLGNTTILAENPTDWDATALLQQVASSQQSSSGGWRTTGKPSSNATDKWSANWTNNPTSASLWGTNPLDSNDPARATPSSLNSYLPGDLLGGESM